MNANLVFVQKSFDYSCLPWFCFPAIAAPWILGSYICCWSFCFVSNYAGQYLLQGHDNRDFVVNPRDPRPLKVSWPPVIWSFHTWNATTARARETCALLPITAGIWAFRLLSSKILQIRVVFIRRGAYVMVNLTWKPARLTTQATKLGRARNERDAVKDSNKPESTNSDNSLLDAFISLSFRWTIHTENVPTQDISPTLARMTKATANVCGNARYSGRMSRQLTFEESGHVPSGQEAQEVEFLTWFSRQVRQIQQHGGGSCICLIWPGPQGRLHAESGT